MATCASVVSAYTGLRDSLTALATRTADSGDRTVLLQRAVVSGSLAEQCDAKFSGQDVPGGDNASDQAAHAAQEAGSASGDDAPAIRQVIADTDAANAALQGIVNAGSLRAHFSGNLVGSLRVTPAQRPLARANGNFAIAAAETPSVSAPGYVTDVAKLFPVEAAALFPLGQTIAGNDPIALAIIIVVTALFVVVLRYFATQQDGRPAWNEIGGALISLLLWIGATKGYWVDKGWIDIGISADTGSKLYGFVTIIWVALVPYVLMEKSKRDARRRHRR
jgi:hypothetical protein